MLFAIPDFTVVVKRGFSSEEVSKEDSGAAKTALAKATHAHFAGRYEVAQIGEARDDAQPLKSRSAGCQDRHGACRPDPARGLLRFPAS